MVDQGTAREAQPPWSLSLYVTGGILLVLVTRNVFVAATSVLELALAALVGAVLLSPVVAVVARALPRLLAIMLVFLVIGVAGLAVRSVYVTEVQDQVDFLAERGPQVAADIEARNDRVGETARNLGLIDRVAELTDRLQQRLGTRTDAFRETALSVPTYAVAFILTIFLMVFGPATLAGGLDRLSERRRQRVADSLDAAARATQLQVGAALVLATIVGASIWLAGWWLGVPAAGLLALAGACASIVPYVGILIGSLPLVIAGLGVAPGWQVAIVAACAAGMQLAEATQWRPRLDRRSLYVGPAVPVIVGVIGYAVNGFNGAIVACIVAVFALGVADFVATDEPLPTPLDNATDPPEPAPMPSAS
jgi:putative heme transporter